MKNLGICYKKESEIYHNYKDPIGKHNYGGWFHFKGSIFIQNKALEQESIEKKSAIITLGEDFQFHFVKEGALCFFDQQEKRTFGK